MYGYDRRMNGRRVFAVVLCAALVLVALFSGMFIAHASSHVCTHSDCPVCAVARQCGENLKLMGMGRIVYCMAVLIQVFALAVLPRMMNADAGETPLARKVRLNN